MRARPWLFLLAAAALVAAGTAAADPVGRYLYVSPMAGYTIFDGDFNWPGAHPLADDLYAGGRIGYQYGPAWAFELAGGYTPTSEDVSGGQDVSFLHATGNIVFSPWSSRVGGPYLFAGGGLGRLNASGGEAGDADLDQGLLEGGGGVKLWLTDAIGVRLEARVSHWMPKESGGAPSVNYVMLTGGLTFGIGAKGRDTDGDRVPDSRDQCAATPRGATVDKKGCPSDTDGDAVLDGIDQCAATPRGCTVDAKGCPSDADGDGVCDGVDQCADTPKGATVDAKGCPSDADGDAVLDGIDQCADTPRGCTVDAKGCPSDADGDGVCDGIDQCADTPAGLKVDEKGCVIELVERETELMDTGRIRLQNIHFDTGKATLKPESFQTLDVVGTLLSQWPTLKIEIAGHTDDVGGAALNRKLSLARAQSVLDYLKGKYPAIDATRFTAKGYGKDKPLVPNVSDESRAQNRRVEFTVLNKEVLQKEVERRRLLLKGETAPSDTTTTP
jgi:OmpA-OmpF porin, OOP family